MSDEESIYRELSADLTELSVHVWLIGTVVESMPEEAQENWRERLEGYRVWANDQIAEVQRFGTAFDR